MVKEKQKLNEKRQKYEVTNQLSDNPTNICGGALGPDWATNRSMKGALSTPRQVHIEYKVEVKNILTPEQYQQRKLTDSDAISWSVYVELTNGKFFGCDFVVSAIGVTPNVELCLKSVNVKINCYIHFNKFLLFFVYDILVYIG